MKRSCIVFNSFFLVVLLTCLFSCKSETLVETILEYQAGTDVSAPSKDLVVQQLKSRFSDGTYGEVIIEAVPQGVRVVTALEDTSLQSLRDLDVYFGSLEVGLYDAANLSDPEIESWLGQVELPEGIYQDIQRSLGLNQNILLQAQEGTDFDKLLNSLKATIPQEKDYIMFWSLPGKLYGYDGPNGRSLHLYRDTKSTGGPRLDNASIKSAKTVETEYGIDAIEAEFTAKGTIEFERMTTEAFNDNQRSIGIVVGEEVWSNPSVQTPIPGGVVWISGDGIEDSALGVVSRQLAWEPLAAELRVRTRRVLPKE